MKKKSSQRILGRRLARELQNDEMAATTGGVSTWTLRYPADGPYNDSSSNEPIWV